jgi:hypothetical protein
VHHPGPGHIAGDLLLGGGDGDQADIGAQIPVVVADLAGGPPGRGDHGGTFRPGALSGPVSEIVMNNIDVQDVEVPGAAGRVQRFGHQLSNPLQLGDVVAGTRPGCRWSRQRS